MKFYNEKSLSLPLDVILAQKGYFYKKEKCSANFLTMKNEKDDLIVITRQNNGHYLYFNPINDADKGNIYSFCKNRNLSIDDLLDKKDLKDLQTKEHNIKPSSLNNKAIEAINAYNELNPLNLNDNFLHTQRLINKDILAKFSGLKTDKFGNACVPSFLNNEYKGVALINQCGFMSYLSKPLNKGEALIKQLCYGKKGLEVLKGEDVKAKELENIIVCESMIDALSLFELKGFESKNVLLCSTNGQITQSHLDMLKGFVSLSKNAKFTLGFDNDEKGVNFTKKISEILKGQELCVLKPILKDFNDDLVMIKCLNLNKDFNLNHLQKLVENEFINKIIYFLDKKGDFYEYSFEQKLNEALLAKERLNFIKPKFEAFCEKNFKQTMDNALFRMSEFIKKQKALSR